MDTSASVTFGDLLRRYRLAAGLTQEELAERAHLSPRAISDLERGARNRPWRDTIQLLATALKLEPAERAQLEGAARQASHPAPGVAGREAREGGTTPGHNLPVPMTSFVGREREIAQVRQRLATTRLLTLTATGGSGKTRLALQVAADVSEQFPDGVFFVPLAPISPGTSVLPPIAQVVGVKESADRSLSEHLAEALRGRQMLLVLDNFEHVAAAAGDVAALLGACPGLKVLVTSRSPLHLQGEHESLVPPLSIPDRDHLAHPAQTLASEAVRLFVERARAVRPDFNVTDQNVATVVEICRRLDGLPLAIELAAALVKALPVEDLAARLGEQLRLLTRGSRGADPRQQTLRATFDWSYNLLAAPERSVFRRLAVFAGGFPLAAADFVCVGDDVNEWEVLPLLIELVDKSLVEMRERDGVARYHLLEPLRQYGWDRLVEAGEADVVRDRHRDWCLALVEQGEPGRVEDRSLAWVERIESEQHNVRVALAFCVERDVQIGLRLVAGMSTFWWHRSLAAENERWIDLLLARATEATPLRVNALFDTAMRAAGRGDYLRATSRAEEALRVARDMGENGWIGAALGQLGRRAADRGDYVHACELCEEGLGLARQTGSLSRIVNQLSALGDVTLAADDLARAREAYSELIELSTKLGDRAWIAWGYANQGAIAHATGDAAQARALLEKAVEGLRDAGHRPGLSYSLASLGYVVGMAGDEVRALALLCESLVLLRELGHLVRAARTLCFLGILAVRQGAFARGVRLFGAAEAVCGYYRVWLDPVQRTDLEASVASARAALGEETFASAWAEGQAMTLEQAVAYALEEDGD
jgi:non-specific serine/threonine protein kinase